MKAIVYVGLAEAAEIVGISKRALAMRRRRDKMFPEPVANLRMGPVWTDTQIADWKKTWYAGGKR